MVVGDSHQSQNLDRTHVPEVSDVLGDLEVVIARNPADCEEPIVWHIQDRDKVADLHVGVPLPVAHPPMLARLLLDIIESKAIRPPNFEVAEILTLVPSPSLAEQSVAQRVIQELPVFLRIPARPHGPTVHNCFLRSVTAHRLPRVD